MTTTGPFKTVIDTPKHLMERVSYRQSIGEKGYRTPLPYSFRDLEISWESHPIWPGRDVRAGSNIASIYLNDNDPYNVRQSAYNKAYAKFQRKVGGQAGFGETIATYKQSFDLATTIFGLLRRPSAQIDKLYRRYKKDRTTPLTDVPGAFLAYRYGIAPLFGDIEACISLLDSPVPPKRIQATGRDSWSDDNKLTWPYATSRIAKSAGVKLGAQLELNNPNVYIAQRLGLTNPVALGWDLIPFSFVVDKIYNIGGYLHSFDDNFGLSMANPYVTTLIKTEGGEFHSHPEKGADGYGATGVKMTRVPGGLPSPRPTITLSLSKGTIANFIALFMSVMGGKLRN